MSGLSTRAISDIERGRAVPRAATVRLMAGTLGLSRPETARLLVAVRAAASRAGASTSQSLPAARHSE
jgi:transcriptional regulator with XRE-family HTH domain